MLEYAFMQRALIGGLLVSIIAPFMGTFIVVRRMSLIGDSLSHVALSGIVLAALFGVEPIYGAVVITVIAAYFIFFLRENYASYEEISLAIIMSSGIALASVLMGFSKNIRGNFLSYLFGSITGISNQDIYIMIALSIIIFAFWGVNYYKLFHMAFDEESAKAMGIKTDKLGKIFIILIALCVVVSMRIVGVLLISSMMVIPVAAAMQYSLSFKQTINSSIIIAVISVIGGITLSFYFDLASGGTIVLISVIILIASILLKGRR